MQGRTTKSGILFVLAACLVWGLIYVVPKFLSSYSSLEIALGRCFFFGTIALYVFCFHRRDALLALPQRIWIKGAWLALLGSVIHFFALVMGMRYSNYPTVTLILGTTPVCVALYENFKKRERKFGALVSSCVLIGGGLVLINLPTFQGEEMANPGRFFYGIFWGIVALFTWIWFMTTNADFLKGEQHGLRTSDWVTLLGLLTLFWTLLIIIGLGCFYPTRCLYFLHFSSELIPFLVGTLILGFCSSWLGAYFWNQATIRLPITLAGQLCIFETVVGLALVHLMDLKWPALIQGLGMVLIFGGILLNFYFKKAPQESPAGAAVPILENKERDP